jgi:hypothetical protein
MTKSFDVTFAASSICSTTSSGVGTQTTSFPGCPGTGAGGVCAEAAAATPRSTTTVKLRERSRRMRRGISLGKA